MADTVIERDRSGGGIIAAILFGVVIIAGVLFLLFMRNDSTGGEQGSVTKSESKTEIKVPDSVSIDINQNN